MRNNTQARGNITQARSLSAQHGITDGELASPPLFLNTEGLEQLYYSHISEVLRHRHQKHRYSQSDAKWGQRS